MRVGLLGGSFDPPHRGHLAISQTALSALDLHAMIWLVSPQNPLKDHQPAPQAQRLKACRDLIRHPRIFASDIEAEGSAHYSIDTIRSLQKSFPEVDFVWLMGSDNFASFHRWHQWQDIMAAIPIAVYPRQGSTLHAGLCPAAQIYAAQRCSPRRLAQQSGPAWAMLSGPHYPISSSAIRHQGM